MKRCKKCVIITTCSKHRLFNNLALEDLADFLKNAKDLIEESDERIPPADDKSRFKQNTPSQVMSLLPHYLCSFPFSLSVYQCLVLFIWNLENTFFILFLLLFQHWLNSLAARGLQT